MYMYFDRSHIKNNTNANTTTNNNDNNDDNNNSNNNNSNNNNNKSLKYNFKALCPYIDITLKKLL